MGELTLPNTGTIYLDASGFIYSLERIEPYCTLLEPMWRHAQAGQFVIATTICAYPTAKQGIGGQTARFYQRWEIHPRRR